MFPQLVVKGSLAKPIVYNSCLRRLTVSAPLKSPIFSQVNIKYNPSSTFIIVRTLMRGPQTTKAELFASTLKLQKIRIRDRVPKQYNMIYRSESANYLFAGQIGLVFVVFSVIFALVNNYFVNQSIEQSKLDGTYVPRDPLAELPPEPKDWFNIAVEEARIKGGHQEEWERKLLPDYRDMVNDSPEAMAMLLAVIALYFFALLYVQRNVPVRIYASNSGHCIACYYSSLIPGRVKLREFVAGTVTEQKTNWIGLPQYKDAAGKKMFFYHEGFRTPEDFNRLLEQKKFND